MMTIPRPMRRAVMLARHLFRKRVRLDLGEVVTIMYLAFILARTPRWKRTEDNGKERGRNESVAEHVSLLMVLAMLMLRERNDLSFLHVLYLIPFHDFPEGPFKDVIVYGLEGDELAKARRVKLEGEARAKEQIAREGGKLGRWLVGLMDEYDNKSTPEACYVGELDKAVAAFYAVFSEIFDGSFVKDPIGVIEVSRGNISDKRLLELLNELSRWYLERRQSKRSR